MTIVNFLKQYGVLSGQIVNYSKSSLYFGRTVGRRIRASIKHIMQMNVGSFPCLYLGVPLFPGKPRRTHLQQLYDRTLNKFSSWTKLLSIAGRVTPVKSVISGALNHTFAVYRWPVLLLKSLERAIRNFIWTGVATTRKLVTVSWKRLCTTLDEGGLGVRSLPATNKALLCKLAWSILECPSNLLAPLRSRFLTPKGTPRTVYYKSSIWSSIREIFVSLLAETLWLVGEHSVVKFWDMNWLGYLLCDRIDVQLIENRGALVSDFLQDGEWKVPTFIESEYPDIHRDIMQTPIIRGGGDRMVWKPRQSGKVTTRAAYDQFVYHHPVVSWGRWLWAPYIPPRRSMLVWRLMHNALPTQSVLQQRGTILVSACSFCLRHEETVDHIFLACPFSAKVWCYFLNKFPFSFDISVGIAGFLLEMINFKASKGVVAILRALFMAICSEIWYARNLLLFQNSRMPFHTLVARIWSAVNDLSRFKFGIVYNDQLDLLMLQYFKLSGYYQRPKVIKEVWWNCPSGDWIKVNIDGSAREGDGRLVSGGVFRNFRGFFRHAFACSAGFGYAHEAELLAFIIAIETAVEKSWLKLWIESDSALVVHLVRTRSESVPWNILVRWLNCLRSIDSMDFVISHIYREGNQAADALTKLDVDGLHTWTTCPQFLWVFLCKDLQGMPYYRFT